MKPLEFDAEDRITIPWKRLGDRGLKIFVARIQAAPRAASGAYRIHPGDRTCLVAMAGPHEGF